jgi:hypothetical protein
MATTPPAHGASVTGVPRRHPSEPPSAAATGGESSLHVEAASVAPRGAHPQRADPPKPAFMRFAITCLAVAWGACLWLGWPYYRLELAERVHSPLHAYFKPSGIMGLMYAYLGTFFLLVLLLYSLRKRVRPLRSLGKLSDWLHVHIFCGIAGPAFITLHSGFRFEGLIAVGYWSMICVFASGCLGYYLYRQIPRAILRDEEQLRALQDELGAIDTELERRFGLKLEHREALRDIAGVDAAPRLGAFGSLPFWVWRDLTLGWRLGRFRRRFPELAGLGRRRAAQMRQLVRRRVFLDRRRAFLGQAKILFGYWHAFHKPFAILLYVAMGVHIGIAIWLGYAWFS